MKRIRRLIAAALTLTMLLSLSVTAYAAETAVGSTLRIEETSGTVTVKDSAGSKKTLRSSMKLYSGYTVATGKNSYAYISLDDSKVVKLGGSGKVQVKKSGKKLELELTTGQLYFNVTKPLTTDETLSIRTTTMVTGVRGSFGWVTNDQVGLMHGHVMLTCSDPDTGITVTTEVTSGEKVSFDQVSAAAAAQQGATEQVIAESFVKGSIVNDDVPALVVEEVVKDETLQTQLTTDVKTVEVVGLIESLPEKQAAEAAKEEAAHQEAAEKLAEQQTTIAEEAAKDATAAKTLDLSKVEKDTTLPEPPKSEQAVTPITKLTETSTAPDTKPTDSGSTSGGGSSSGGSGGGGDNGGTTTPQAPSQPTETYELTTVTDASKLQTALNTYKKVLFKGSAAATIADLTIPANKELVIGDATDSFKLDVTGQLVNNGRLTVSGACELKLTDTSTTRNNGTINVDGRMVNDGTFHNYGAINTTSGSSQN